MVTTGVIAAGSRLVAVAWLIQAIIMVTIITKGNHQIASAMSTAPPLSSAIRQKMEDTVRRYFQGVNNKNPHMIASCFQKQACIRDVCALLHNKNSEPRMVPADMLVQRCMDFVTAHPDCKVDFYYGPECGRSSEWVVAHWYETGTWTGISCGVTPPTGQQPTSMAVEGQTRFLVDPVTLKIKELVVTRTFTDWERALMMMDEQ
jgi:hypothetical protein